MSRTTSVTVRLLKGAAFTVALCLGLLFVATAAGPQLGFQYAVVESGSMEPAYRVGSVIVTREADAASITVGDVISWRVPEDPRKVITHRVIEVIEANGAPAFRTQGDANEVADGAFVPAASLKGKVVFSVPQVGYLVPLMRSPLLFLALIILPGGILIAGELRKIWLDLRGETARAASAEGVLRDFEPSRGA